MTDLVPGQRIEEREFKSSSSNNVYTAILYENCVSCTCPAGGRKSYCKHVEKLVKDNMNLLLEKCPNFADKLTKIFSKSTEKELKKELFKEISFVNKDIAAQAHSNALILDINVSKIKLEAEARAKKFILTTQNVIKTLNQGYQDKVINQEEFNECIEVLKNSVSTINNELTDL